MISIKILMERGKEKYGIILAYNTIYNLIFAFDPKL